MEAEKAEWLKTKEQLQQQAQNALHLKESAERERERDDVMREREEGLHVSQSGRPNQPNQPRIESSSQVVGTAYDQARPPPAVDGSLNELPPNWEKHFSGKVGRHYYRYSDGTIEFSQWHFPTISEAADPSKAMERAKKNTSDEQRKRQRND